MRLFFHSKCSHWTAATYWRKLILRAAGKGNDTRFGVALEAHNNGTVEEHIIQEQFWRDSAQSEENIEPTILDMLCSLCPLLSTKTGNFCLRAFLNWWCTVDLERQHEPAV
jgi:hypothetical protein